MQQNNVYRVHPYNTPSSFPIRTLTVGFGISPNRGNLRFLRRLYCRWGITPRPKELNLIF